jgi:hypothetical protein
VKNNFWQKGWQIDYSDTDIDLQELFFFLVFADCEVQEHHIFFLNLGGSFNIALFKRTISQATSLKRTLSSIWLINPSHEIANLRLFRSPRLNTTAHSDTIQTSAKERPFGVLQPEKREAHTPLYAIWKIVMCFMRCSRAVSSPDRRRPPSSERRITAKWCLWCTFRNNNAVYRAKERLLVASSLLVHSMLKGTGRGQGECRALKAITTAAALSFSGDLRALVEKSSLSLSLSGSALQREREKSGDEFNF